MPATFLDRNKKKSLLAALLLFLRQRKILVVLLLLVLIASTVFLSPSSWLTSFPGGARFVAGVAWIAGKMGIDVSRWGLGGGKRSYADLLAAFRAAREGSGSAVGWGPFFGRGKAAGGAASPDSVGYVEGSKSDLDHGTGPDGGPAPGGQTVAGIVNPDDPKNGDANAVQIADQDVGGEREGFLKEAFAGGFVNGLLGGVGGSAAGSLSGGPFATKGFFSGNGGAAGSSSNLAKAGLSGLSAASTPSSVKGGAAVGKLSAMASRGVEARAMKGILGAAAIGGNLAYTQLAEGNAQALLGTQYCQAPACPPEFATTNTGAIYDGSDITAGLLTSSDPSGIGAGLIGSSVSIPPEDSGGLGGGGAAGDAQNTQTCATMMQQCASSKQAPMEQEGVDENQLETWYGQMAGACGNPCNCGPCNALKNQISGLCNGDLATQIAAADAPCAPLPDYCAALGFTNSDPSSTANTSGQNLCQQNVGQCGCSSFFCSLGCLLGS